MIKFLAVILRNSNTGQVMPVADPELARVVASLKAKGHIVVGEYTDRRHADRAVELALRGGSPRRSSGGKSFDLRAINPMTLAAFSAPLISVCQIFMTPSCYCVGTV
jgi:hypothetical protein